MDIKICIILYKLLSYCFSFVSVVLVAMLIIFLSIFLCKSSLFIIYNISLSPIGWFITKTLIIRDCLIISIFSSCRSILLINFQYEKAVPLCVWQWSVLQAFSLDYRHFRHARWDNKQFRSWNNQCNAEILVEVFYRYYTV